MRKKTGQVKKSAPRTAAAILDALYKRPGFLIRRVNQIAAAVHFEACGPWGLTQAQHGALLIAHCCPGIDQTGIGQALGFDRATTGQVLRGLEARGLVGRAVSGKDGRRRSIAPTREGEELVKLPAGELARVEKERGNYLYVRADGDRAGWVRREEFERIWSRR